MRKLKLFSLLAVLVCAASVNVVFAQTTINHVNYEFDEDAKTATVVGADYTWENSDVSLVIPAQVEYNSQNYAVTAIGDDAFREVEYLVSIELPEGLLSIGDAAFNQTYNLASINIPNSVTSVGEEAFAEAFKAGPSGENAIDIVLGNGLTVLSKYMFSYATMKSVTLQEGLLEIKQGAFEGCGNLTSITIPSTVTHIWGSTIQGEADAFQDCNELTDIYCYADPANLTWDDTNSDAFIATPAKTTVCHVKSCELAAFQTKFAHVNVTFEGDLPCAAPATPAITGKLTGEFSINSTGGKVNFSSGNLQYLASTNTWSFAENQYDYIGAAPGNNVYTGRASQAQWIDLFCWGTGTNPTYISYNGADFLPGITGEEYEFGTANDWGTAAAKDLGNGWRTLNKAEWLYILEGRDNAANLWTKATVDGKAGLLLLPDGWTADGVTLTITGTSGAFTTNELDLDEWATLQNQGAVFLPAAGFNNYRPDVPEYQYVGQAGEYGYYWLATAAADAMGDKRADATMFYDSHIYTFTYRYRCMGASVRLVQDVQAPNTRDDVSGIEDAMAALIGTGATDLTIVRDLYKDGFFNTLCLPFSLNASEIAAGPLAGCELYTFTSATYNGGGLDINISSTTEIEAGVPYLIRWENTGEVMTSLLFTGVTVTTSTGIVTGSGEVNFIGTIGRSTLPHGNVSYLFVGESNNLYWSDSSDATSMKGFRAYFRINNLGGQESVPRHAPARLVIAAPKTPTAVENVQGNNVQSTKVIENGQLFIIKNGVKYNAQGKVVK